MTRGTVCIIGAKSRESELFVARLEREHFEVVSHVSAARFTTWTRKNVTQAVLVTDRLSKSSVESVVRSTVQRYSSRRIPIILLAHDEVPSALRAIKGVGESFRFHRISVKEALNRLILAIQLTQLARV